MNKNKRDVLKGLAVGSVWATPVVSSVVLPVHAETSGNEASGVSSEISFPTSGNNSNNPEYIVKMLNVISDDAHASPDISRFHLCVFPKQDDSMVDVKVRREVGVEECLSTEDFEAIDVPVNNTYRDLNFVEEACDKCSDTHMFQILFNTIENGAKGEISDGYGGRYQFDIPFGGCSLPTVNCCIEESDIRLKTDIQALGETPSGISIYRYKYLKDENQTEYVGVMAQDLVETYPNALVIGEDGYYRVKYSELGMQMVRFEKYEKYGMNAVNLVN